MSWKEDLIEEAEKVIKHGWGKVVFLVTNNGRNHRIETTTSVVKNGELKAEQKKDLTKPF